MKGYGRKRAARDDPDSTPDAVTTATAVKSNMIRVLGEGDETELCWIPLDTPNFPPVDADTLRVLICSRIDDMFPNLMPSTMALLSHPDRAELSGPACMIHGGSTVHLVSVKGRTGLSGFAGEPSVIFFKDLHLEIPDGQDASSYAHELLGLAWGSHHIVQNSSGERWLVPIPAGSLPPLSSSVGRIRTMDTDDIRDGSGVNVDDSGRIKPLSVLVQTSSGLPPLPRLPDMSRIMPTKMSPQGLDKEDAIVIDGDPGDDCAWEDRINSGDEPMTWNYDEHGEDDDDGQEEDQGEITSSILTVPTSLEAVLYLPDGTRLLLGVSDAGYDASQVLMAVCIIKGWDASNFKITEHGLPILATLITASSEYDIRVKR